MLKRTAIALFVILSAWNVSGQNRAVRFEEIKALQSLESKPLVVLIMTDWCKYCHAMQNTMLKSPKVSQLLRNKFYTVFLNAEEKKSIFFAGREFKYKQGANELAQELATINGRVSYPTLCILNAKNEIIYQYDGFLSAQAMEEILKKLENEQIRE
ncbi:MAG: thioredoxin family protein [Daejeonella sp.]|uniref:thioredoxin family protein n=1 Tax=Daejeonella sp. TaxID=2805397 RepID=UPI003C77D71F